MISTLDHLAALDYPAFEVVVIDNNTIDPALWQPVEAHCARLGSRFRFLHIEGLAGAKAAALNWARSYVDRSAHLIGVVDADYHVDPSWLRRTVGFFDDATVGFVQPPHAYRNWDDRRFGRMANWEYDVFFRTGMVALQEHGAGLTVGTMSVIRCDALDAAGGWAEWCQTEDSELAIRIHDKGFRSVYLQEPLGWGLIPDTFAHYRKQRYRWTYGPVQELKHHWRRFLPEAMGGSPTLTWRQKLHHANHGLDVAMVGLRLLLWPLGMAAAASLIVHQERIAMPLPLWVAMTAVFMSNIAVRWLSYCHITRASLSGAIGAIVAYRALHLTISLASVAALVGRQVPWMRTDKFRSRPDLRAALAATRTEAAAATVFGATAAVGLLAGSAGVVRMLAIGFAVQAATYACAPVVSLISDRDIDKGLDTTGLTSASRALSSQDVEARQSTTA